MWVKGCVKGFAGWSRDWIDQACKLHTHTQRHTHTQEYDFCLDFYVDIWYIESIYRVFLMFKQKEKESIKIWQYHNNITVDRCIEIHRREKVQINKKLQVSSSHEVDNHNNQCIKVYAYCLNYKENKEDLKLFLETDQYLLRVT